VSTARVRHLIEIIPAEHAAPIVFEFWSRDIGCTQGTTIRHGETLVAHYRPGTRYWETALDCSVEMLAEAIRQASEGQPHWDLAAFPGRFAAVLAANHCSPWDGTDPEWD
jgi:hypothetical protein